MYVNKREDRRSVRSRRSRDGEVYSESPSLEPNVQEKECGKDFNRSEYMSEGESGQHDN